MKLTRGERFEEARKLSNKTMDTVVKETNDIQIPAEGYPDRNPKKKISKSTISKLENSEIPDYENEVNLPEDVGYSKIAKLALCYGVSADYLMGLSDIKSPDITVQGIGKITGLSDDAIKALQYFNNSDPKTAKSVGFAKLTNNMAMKRLNSFLEHPKIGEFIYNIQQAIQYYEYAIPEDATGKDGMSAEEAAAYLGGVFLYQDDAVKYHRQEAINALRDIVHDLVPDKKTE